MQFRYAIHLGVTMQVKKLYYFSGTHWDREWYQTFQGFRFRLERALREMIEYLEQADDFEVFYFDGQTIVFEDFLEIAPEYTDRLQKLLRDGKIRIGPWYTMPDELLVSGESIIRNLQRGHRICQQLGTDSWKVGYVCDIFGHIAQLPQIFAGFDIHTAVLGRGTNDDTTTMFFRWSSPDGSSCVSYKLPSNMGYGSFALEVMGTRAQQEQLLPESAEFRRLASAYIDREMQRSNTDTAVLMDAADHEAIHPMTSRYIQEIEKLYPDVEVIHGRIEECFAHVAEWELPEKKGELIETSSYPAAYHNLLTNILSSRVDIKRRNDKCQAMLEQWMEPLVVYWNMIGVPVTKEYLNVAWKNLLQNHPHDSICGCSVDRVHTEMGYRFSQVESICEALTEEPLLVKTGEFLAMQSDGSTHLNILNLGLTEERRAITVDIPFERDYPVYQEGFGYEPIHAFRLYTAEGQEIPYRIEEICNNATFRRKSELVKLVDRYTVTFSTDLKPFGTTTIAVVPQKGHVRFGGRIADYEGNMENEYLMVTLESDGRITIRNKKNGACYTDLLGLLSDSEIGDGWWSVRNKCSATSAKTTLESVHVLSNNATGASVKVRRLLQVPAQVEETAYGIKQSETMVTLPVDTTLTLNAGEDFLRVKMVVHNCAKDHRLRLHIPTDTASKSYMASQAFAMVERTAGVDEQTLWFKEPDQLEKNTDGILLRMDESGKGLAFISAYGIHEGGCDNDKRSSMVLTLLRSFYRTHTKNNETGGQIQGDHVYSFVLKPVDNDSPNDLLKLKNQLKSKVFPFVAKKEMQFGNSMIRLETDAVVSCLKPADTGDGVVLRVYNAEKESKKARIVLSEQFSTAWRMNLLEQREAELNVVDNAIEIEVGPHQILSIGIQ